MRPVRWIAALAIVLCAGLGTQAAGFQEGPGGPPDQGKAENVRERIETLRMWKMTKALELDEKTSAQVIPVMNKYDRNRTEREKLLRQAMRELREELRDPAGSGREARVRDIVLRIEQNHDVLQRLNDDEWKELKAIFTVEQQARYIIFKQDFDRELRQMIGEARGRRMERRNQQQTEPPHMVR